jgi:hypothetical protein
MKPSVKTLGYLLPLAGSSATPGWNVEAVRKSSPKRARQTALRGRMIHCSSPSMLKFARLGKFVSATEY